jgi:hypothetical protein
MRRSVWTLAVAASVCLVIVGLNIQTLHAAGSLIISEFRLQGLGGVNDEFIEIYNDSSADHTVAAISGSGYGIAASDGVVRCTIPNGIVIPAHGHWLCVNSLAYNLGNYPSGNGTTAAGDGTYTTDIPLNAGIALFNNNTGGGSFTLVNRFDAVGSVSEANVLYKEGSGLPALASGVASVNHAFVRDECGKGGAVNLLGPCTISTPKDTDSNSVDFFFVDANGTSAGAGQRLGAPGPQNLSSPIQRNSTIGVVLVDATVSSSLAPNRVRDLTPANPNGTQGTLSIRRRFVNNTGAPVTRLRFRIIDLDTFPAALGFADLRPRTSGPVVVSAINDTGTCTAAAMTAPCTITVQGTALEEASPPANQFNGGGFNSSYGAGTVTLGTPLASGASVNLQFVVGIQQTGNFRIFLNIEILP